jgi:hypothetical protein
MELRVAFEQRGGLSLPVFTPASTENAEDL